MAAFKMTVSEKTPDLTEAICQCVRYAGSLIGIFDMVANDNKLASSATQQVMVVWGKQIYRCLRDLRSRAAEFRAHYPTPPTPLAGISAASYHELGIKLAEKVHVDIMATTNRSNCELMLQANDDCPEYDYNAISENWPRVKEYLQKKFHVLIILPWLPLSKTRLRVPTAGEIRRH